MNGFHIRFKILLILAFILHNFLITAQSVNILPYPDNIKIGEEHFEFTPQTVIEVENEDQHRSVQIFAELFEASAGFMPKVIIGKSVNPDVRLITDSSLSSEAYKLTVMPDGIIIYAADNAGFFYALQTLRHLLPTEIEHDYVQKDVRWLIPCVEISDKPRFEYRGLLLDVSRYFIPKETVLKVIETMSSLKINYLHLHLVDDNGWRLEIKQYPELTDIGAWRAERQGVPFPARHNPSAHEPATVGGYYTQDDMRDIISFASDRHINIIPEIEMPAHTVSSLAAFPELACPVVEDYIGVLPGLGGNNAHIIYCAGNDSVFNFLENIIDEVAELFPSKYIHLGGDEANKYHWERCPLCQARMKEEGIPDEEHLQSYFMRRVSSYVQSKGKEVMGWDEITNGEIPEGVIVFGWEENGKKALKATSQGHKVIMTPARTLYLIRYQGPQWFEPLTYFGNNTLSDVYHYEPILSDWDSNAESLLMGVQASLWTEFCSSPEDVEYLLFPRLTAFADMAWRAKGESDWNNFLTRLDSFNERLAARHITYSRSMFNLDHKVEPNGDGTLSVSVTCTRPDVSVRFTTDGSNPSNDSYIFPKTLTLNKNSLIKAATFKDGVQMGKTLTLPINFNKTTGIIAEGNGNESIYMLTNGLRGSDKYTDFEWCGWYGDNFSFTIDLQKPQQVQFITLGTITNFGMAVHKPSEIIISASEDNINFNEVARLNKSREEIFIEGTFREDKTLGLGNITTRYIRVEGKNPGNCPDNHIRPGQKSWVYLDEIIIE